MAGTRLGRAFALFDALNPFATHLRHQVRTPQRDRDPGELFRLAVLARLEGGRRQVLILEKFGRSGRRLVAAP